MNTTDITDINLKIVKHSNQIKPKNDNYLKSYSICVDIIPSTVTDSIPDFIMEFVTDIAVTVEPDLWTGFKLFYDKKFYAYTDKIKSIRLYIRYDMDKFETIYGNQDKNMLLNRNKLIDLFKDDMYSKLTENNWEIVE